MRVQFTARKGNTVVNAKVLAEVASKIGTAYVKLGYVVTITIMPSCTS